MDTLKGLLPKLKPTTPTELVLLRIIQKLGRVAAREQGREGIWGPAHQAISDCKREINQAIAGKEEKGTH